MRVLFTAAVLSISGAAAAENDSDRGDWNDALNASIKQEWSAPEYRGFDFWIGEWEMHWRSRPEGEFHHQKNGSWTHQRVFPILGGKAIVELAWARDNPETASQRGFSIRYYDPARSRWVMAQNWPNATQTGAAFLDQLIGEEYHGRMSVYSIVRQPQPDGSINIQHRRYNFSDIRPGVSFRWDGSNTADEGATWTTWNIVDAHRRRDLDPYKRAGASFPGVHERALCTEEPHGAFNFLEGVWSGTITDSEGNVSNVRYSAGLGLDGCGVLSSLEEENRTTFLAYGYSARHKKWIIYRLDDQPGTTHGYFISDTADEGAVFTHAPDLSIKDEFTAYNLPEYFDPEASQQRVIWERTDDRNITIRVEARDDASTPWSTVARYELVK